MNFASISSHKLSILVLHEFLGREDSGGNTHAGIIKCSEVFIPLSNETNLKKSKEVISIRRTNSTSNRMLGLNDVGSSIWVKSACLINTISCQGLHCHPTNFCHCIIHNHHLLDVLG